MIIRRSGVPAGKSHTILPGSPSFESPVCGVPASGVEIHTRSSGAVLRVTFNSYFSWILVSCMYVCTVPPTPRAAADKRRLTLTRKQPTTPGWQGGRALSYLVSVVWTRKRGYFFGGYVLTVPLSDGPPTTAEYFKNLRNPPQWPGISSHFSHTNTPPPNTRPDDSVLILALSNLSIPSRYPRLILFHHHQPQSWYVDLFQASA